MLIYTIVVTRNAENWLDSCLSGLRESSVKTHVVIIDNASEDATVQKIRTRYPEVELVPLHKNRGFGAANNIGLRLALQREADYVLLLNQDARLEKNTLGVMLEKRFLRHDIGILSPMQYHRAGELDHHFELYYNGGKEKYPSPGTLQCVDFVNAAIWLIPTDVVRKVGCFSPLFYHYGEDNNFSSRILFNKYKIYIATDAVAFHKRPQQHKPQTSYFKYLDTRYRIKTLIYGSDVNATVVGGMKQLKREIYSVVSSSESKTIILRNLLFFRILLFVLAKYPTLVYYRQKSKKEGAFL